jgi:hypothetical protein
MLEWITHPRTISQINDNILLSKKIHNYNRVVSHDNCSLFTAGRKLLQKILSPQSFINVSKTTKQSDASKFAEITLKKYQVLLLKISSRDILCINQ